jgi:hypothetical protein
VVLKLVASCRWNCGFDKLPTTFEMKTLRSEVAEDYDIERCRREQCQIRASVGNVMENYSAEVLSSRLRTNVLENTIYDNFP